MAIYSYSDIQAAYDKELYANREWSVFVLPEGIPYFNTFLHHKQKLSNDAILNYLANLCFVYENSPIYASLYLRLMGNRDLFPNKSLNEFAELVDEIVTAHQDGETMFIPNAVARSIRNPYYKFDTRLANDEKAEVVKEHRRELKELYSNPGLDSKLYEYLESYDLNEGLLSKEKLKRDLGASRFNLDRCFKRNAFLLDMYETIRKASYSKSYKRRQ